MALDEAKIAAEDTFTELRRCKEDPYYFYKKYVRLKDSHGNLQVPEITRERFEKIFEQYNTLL